MTSLRPDRVQWENLDHWDLPVKRVLPVCVETMDLRDDKVNEDQQDPPAAQETKETLEKMDRR